MILHEENSKDQPEIIMLKDSEWSLINGEICKAIDFVPMAIIKNGKTSIHNRASPYASIKFECRKLPQIAAGYITHKIDFMHLWTAFKERMIQQDEEVLFFWSKKYYKGYAKLFPAFMPKMWVMVCPKGAYQLFDPSFKPELEGEARARARVPIVDWKPKVMR